MRLLCLLLSLVLVLASPAGAEPRRLFVFGAEGWAPAALPDRTVPYWLGVFARAEGDRFALDGTTVRLADMAEVLPPEPDWLWSSVERAWRSNRLEFGAVGWEAVLAVPEADASVEMTPEEAADLAAPALSWVRDAAPGTPILLVGSGPDADWTAALALDLSDRLGAEIPILLAAGVVAALPGGPAENDAERALLTAMVVHAGLTGRVPPTDLPRAGVPERLVQMLPEIVRAIPALLADASEGGTDVAPAAVLSSDAAAGGLDDPGLSFSLAPVADYSTQMPFVDIFRSARPWFSHSRPDVWGDITFETLRDGGHLSPEGWPRSLPEGVDSIDTVVLADLPEGAVSLVGRYVLRWQGQAEVEVRGRAFDIAPSQDHIYFSYTPGEGIVHIVLRDLDPADPITGMQLYRVNDEELMELGETFNPQWLSRIADARQLRFMDWMRTNGSTQVTWDDAPKVTDFSYAWRGVPAEVIAELSNLVAADPWVSVPHMADDAYVRQMAALFRERLDPDLEMWVEYSNEVWNWAFPQAHWLAEQAAARYPEGDFPWLQMGGIRAAEVMALWRETWVEESDRIVAVAGTQTVWKGLEEAFLDAPLAVAEGRAPPGQSFDAYAVAGYLHILSDDVEAMTALRAGMEQGEGEAVAEQLIRAGSLALNRDDLFPYHAQVARERGMRLVMYEGGTHVVGEGADREDAALTAFYNAFNYSERMAALYDDLIAAWRAVSDEAFMVFVDVEYPSKWGSWGALRHLDDDSPRWQALMAANREGTGYPGPYRHGSIVRGTAGADALRSSGLGDLVLAGPGDDRIEAQAGDRIHGGPGEDVVVVPGDFSGLTLERDGAADLVSGDWGRLRLAGVERLESPSGESLVLEDAR